MDLPALSRIQERISDISRRMEALSRGPKLRPEELIPKKFQPKSGLQGSQKADQTQPVHTPSLKKQTEAKDLASGLTPTSRRSRFSEELERMIQSEAERAGVSSDLIRAIVKTESNGRPGAVSKAGAIGLMQLMPDTARALGVNPRDPRENLQGGIRYLKELAGRFGELDKTLAAYNAGPGNVVKYGAVPPFRETQNYIRRIRAELDERR